MQSVQHGVLWRAALRASLFVVYEVLCGLLRVYCYLHLIFPLVKKCIAITNVVLDDHVLRSSGNYQLSQLSFSAMLDFYIGKILGTRISEVSGVT